MNRIAISPSTPSPPHGQPTSASGFAKSNRVPVLFIGRIASLVIGVGFLFSWLLWFVVIFELREEMLDHYNRREPMHLRLNWFLTLVFSFVYFQFALNRITREQEAMRESFAVEPETSVTA